MNSKPKNFAEALAELEAKVHELKPQVEDQVKENPWAALGVVGLLCFVLGFLIAGRKRRID